MGSQTEEEGDLTNPKEEEDEEEVVEVEVEKEERLAGMMMMMISALILDPLVLAGEDVWNRFTHESFLTGSS